MTAPAVDLLQEFGKRERRGRGARLAIDTRPDSDECSSAATSARIRTGADENAVEATSDIRFAKAPTPTERLEACASSRALPARRGRQT